MKYKSAESCKTRDEQGKNPASKIAYAHDLSEPIRNKNDTLDYCTMKLQISPDSLEEALLYSPQKRKLLASSEGSRTPIKIQKFTHTKDGKKLIINDITHLSPAEPTEYYFQYTDFKPTDADFTSIQSVLDNAQEYDKVNVKGKVFQLEDKPLENTDLKLASGLLADQESTIPIDIWQPHTSSIENNGTYSFTSLTVRTWQGKKKLSVGRQTKVSTTTDCQLMELAADPRMMKLALLILIMFLQ